MKNEGYIQRVSAIGGPFLASARGKSHGGLLLAVAIGAIGGMRAEASTAVDAFSLSTNTSAAPDSSYQVVRTLGMQTRTDTYNFGAGNNVNLDTANTFSVGGSGYSQLRLADDVLLQHSGGPQGSVNNVNLAYQRQSQIGGIAANRTFNLSSEQAATMQDAILSNVVNRGVPNVFMNSAALQTTNNIERVDYVFSSGLRPQNVAQTQFGFLLLDQGLAPTRFGIAAITGLDGGGNPTTFGAPQTLAALDWGLVTGPPGQGSDYLTSTANGASAATPGFNNNSPGGLWGTFVSVGDLGIGVGQTFYGYSLFAADTLNAAGSGADLADTTNSSFFPTNTNTTVGGSIFDSAGGGGLYANADPSAFLLPEPATAVASLSFLLAGLGMTSRRRRAVLPCAG